MNADSVTRTQSNTGDLFQELSASSHCLEDVQHKGKESMFLAREIPIYMLQLCTCTGGGGGRGTQSEASWLPSGKHLDHCTSLAIHVREFLVRNMLHKLIGYSRWWLLSLSSLWSTLCHHPRMQNGDTQVCCAKWKKACKATEPLAGSWQAQIHIAEVCRGTTSRTTGQACR